MGEWMPTDSWVDGGHGAPHSGLGLALALPPGSFTEHSGEHHGPQM